MIIFFQKACARIKNQFLIKKKTLQNVQIGESCLSKNNSKQIAKVKQKFSLNYTSIKLKTKGLLFKLEVKRFLHYCCYSIFSGDPSQCDKIKLRKSQHRCRKENEKIVICM